MIRRKYSIFFYADHVLLLYPKFDPNVVALCQIKFFSAIFLWDYHSFESGETDRRRDRQTDGHQKEKFTVLCILGPKYMVMTNRLLIGRL